MEDYTILANTDDKNTSYVFTFVETFGNVTEEDSRTKVLFLAEIIFNIIPAMFFLITASIRFCNIRPIGFAKNMGYSKLFLSKLVIQYL